jgi:hypothetical protein
MNVGELIAELEGFDEDTEVRLAMQPSWPFEYSIGGVTEPVETDECPECEVAWASHDEDGCDAERPDEEVKDVVYLAEGSQLGYLPGTVASSIGWS